MALPPIILTRQTVQLVSPADPDVETTSAYSECDDLDISDLKIQEGATRFEVRGLTPHEMDLIGCYAHAEDGEPIVAFVEQLLHAVRFGLVGTTLEVSTTAGAVPFATAAKRGRVNGSHLEAWTPESIEAIDGQTRLFLGRAILRLSTISEKKSAASGSSPGGRNGTRRAKGSKARKVRGRSTAGDAKHSRSSAST